MTEDHKDRFGDKLRKKKKVDEDRYFAELDKMKIERLKRESGTERKPLADCPRCGASLVEHDHLGVLIDESPSCGAISLDQAQLT